MTAQNCLNIKKFFAVAFYKHVSHWQALNPARLKKAFASMEIHTFFKLYQLNIGTNQRLSVIINTALGTRSHCERAGQGPSEAAQIKSKIYNVLNIIKLDSPPLGLGTRLEGSGHGDGCPRSHKLIVLKTIRNICSSTDSFNE